MTQNKVLDVLKDQLKNSVVDASEILDVILSVISNELIDNGIVYIEDFVFSDLIKGMSIFC